MTQTFTPSVYFAKLFGKQILFRAM